MKKLVLSVIVIINILFFSSCHKDEKIYGQHPHLKLSVQHKVDSQYLEFDTLKYVNNVGHKYEVRTLKYFISNIHFHKLGGNKTIIKGPFYVDAEDTSTFNINEHLGITSGTYEKISLTFGLDTASNISNALNSTEAIGMNWPNTMGMGGGYHYMKLEGSYDSLQLGIKKNFTVHTGASMGKPYHIDLEIPNSNFKVSDKDVSVKIQMNVNEWFTDPNDYDFSKYNSMIMMDMKAQAALKANGKSAFTVIVH